MPSSNIHLSARTDNQGYRGILKLGTYGPAVKLVRDRLTALGYKIQSTQHFDPYAFDNRLRAVVMDFQAQNCDWAEPLAVDGIVGPVTWSCLFGPQIPPQLVRSTDDPEDAVMKAALEVARTQFGATEYPPNSNSGPQVDEYLKSVGLPPGSPWCAAFVSWCIQRAAASIGTQHVIPPASGSSRRIWQWARDSNTGIPSAEVLDGTRIPPVGSLFTVAHPGKGDAGVCHIGFVWCSAPHRPGQIETIEGNVMKGGITGGGVHSLRRKIGLLHGFIEYGHARARTKR